MSVDRRVELKETLDNYGKDLKALINIKPKQFETLQVATMITNLPERKWNAAQAVVNNTIFKKDADSKLKVIRATMGFRASNQKTALGLSSASDRSAWVDTQKEVQEAEIESINADAELLSSKLAYECLDDLFTAGKRIMNYLIEQEKQTKEYGRYADEGKKNR